MYMYLFRILLFRGVSLLGRLEVFKPTKSETSAMQFPHFSVAAVQLARTVQQAVQLARTVQQAVQLARTVQQAVQLARTVQQAAQITQTPNIPIPVPCKLVSRALCATLPSCRQFLYRCIVWFCDLTPALM
jgi:hypothetical protein